MEPDRISRFRKLIIDLRHLLAGPRSIEMLGPALLSLCGPSTARSWKQKFSEMKSVTEFLSSYFEAFYLVAILQSGVLHTHQRNPTLHGGGGFEWSLYITDGGIIKF